MNKEELKYEFENGYTVADLIKVLQRLPQNFIVVNNCRDSCPITNIEVTSVDYCYDEIITHDVVSIY